MKQSTIITNFAGGVKKSDLAKLGNASTKNMFVEVNSSDYLAEISLRGMPGWKRLYNSTGTPRAIKKANNGKLFWVAGTNLYCNGNVIASVANTDYCQISETGGPKPRILVADGINLWAVDETLEVYDMPSAIISVELPMESDDPLVKIKAIGVEVADDFVLVLAEGKDRVYYSHQFPWELDVSKYEADANDIFMLHWKDPDGNELGGLAGKWFTSDYTPDISTSIVVVDNKVYVLAKDSVSVYKKAGTNWLYGDSSYGEFWQRQEAYNTGCFKNGACSIVNSIAYVGKNGVYVGNDKVSNDDIDRKIANEGFVKCGYLKWFSHRLFVVYTEKSTIAYDTSNGTWIEMESSYGRFRYEVPNEIYGLCNGAIVEWTEDKFDEHDGTPILKSRRSVAICRELNQKVRIDKVEFITNAGQFNGDGTFKCYKDFKLYKTSKIKLSEWGKYSDGLIFRYLGEGTYWEFELITEANAPVGYYGLKIDVRSVRQ